MPEKQNSQKPHWTGFQKQVAQIESRRLRARKERPKSLWFGMGTFGMVGWSVTIPTLMGIALGLWFDGLWPGRISWTLTFLFLGVGLGCWNAWAWVQRHSDPRSK